MLTFWSFLILPAAVPLTRRLPSVRLRGEVAYGEESLHTGGRSTLDFFFDLDHLRSTLAAHCPQMPLADSLYGIPNFGLAAMPDPVKPKDVYTLATGKPNGANLPWPGFLNPNAGSFRRDFDKVFGAASEFSEDEDEEEQAAEDGDEEEAEVAEDRPTVHRLDFAYFEWNPELDPPAFWTDFGKLLKFSPGVIELASEVHTELVGRNGSYFGMHERLEKDVAEEWGSFDEQNRAYVDRLLARPALSQVYIACGDESALPRVEQYIHTVRNAPHIQIYTKETLLSPPSLERLAALHFDQRAQVDYLVLLKAEFLAGVGTSSFSAGLAIKRHLALEGDQPHRVFLREEDGKSFLLRGNAASFMRQAMWP